MFDSFGHFRSSHKKGSPAEFAKHTKFAKLIATTHLHDLPFFLCSNLFPNQLHPLVAPHVSHFSQVPFRTIVKFWHSEHMLPV